MFNVKIQSTQTNKLSKLLADLDIFDEFLNSPNSDTSKPSGHTSGFRKERRCQKKNR